MSGPFKMKGNPLKRNFKLKIGKGQGSKRTGKYTSYAERDFSPGNISTRRTEGTIAAQDALRKKRGMK